MEDVDLLLDNHPWETAIHLTLAQLNALEHEVTRRHPQPLARMCGPRNNVAHSDANKRRKAAASPYGDVDDRAEPPAKRGHASVKEFVTANCTLPVPYDDLTPRKPLFLDSAPSKQLHKQLIRHRSIPLANTSTRSAVRSMSD